MRNTGKRRTGISVHIINNPKVKNNGPDIKNLLYDPTTSSLTATTLIYAIGAGITAAAGTRLALQLFLVEVFTLHSFQLQDFYQDLYCYLLSLSHRVGIG